MSDMPRIGDVNNAEPPHAAPQDFGWAIVELMGHRVRAGRVREVLVAGKLMLQIQCPGNDGQADEVEIYAGGSLYGMRPCSEGQARAAARFSRPAPLRTIDIDHQLGPAQEDGRDSSSETPDEGDYDEGSITAEHRRIAVALRRATVDFDLFIEVFHHGTDGDGFSVDARRCGETPGRTYTSSSLPEAMEQMVQGEGDLVIKVECNCGAKEEGTVRGLRNAGWRYKGDAPPDCGNCAF